MRRDGEPLTRPYGRPSDATEDGKHFFWDTSGESSAQLDYKVFLPSSYNAEGAAVPLVVMLHGCTQDPDDFALGTRMNALAQRHGFIVAYPQQPASANASKCWNWFRPEDQVRDRGEPSQIARMIGDLTARYRIDRKRVFAAGMSAGAAMVVVLARTYPELFTAIGVHSGLPYRCANNVVSALAVMKNARACVDRHDATSHSLPVPAIVFHGDHDTTVDHSNADALVRQWQAEWSRTQPLANPVAQQTTDGGRVCDRVIHKTTNGKSVIEYWTIRGATHCWSGGDVRGSHTVASGPDAAAEFWRFFRASAAQ